LTLSSTVARAVEEVADAADDGVSWVVSLVEVDDVFSAMLDGVVAGAEVLADNVPLQLSGQANRISADAIDGVKSLTRQAGQNSGALTSASCLIVDLSRRASGEVEGAGAGVVGQSAKNGVG